MTTPGLHPDLVRIRQAVEEHDAMARSREDGDVTSAILHLGLVDYDSLFIASCDRAAQAMSEINPLTFLVNPAAGLSATWADGFLAGVRFAKLAAEEAAS